MHPNTASSEIRNVRVRYTLALVAWLLAATALAALGVMSGARPYVPLLSIAIGLAVLVCLYRLSTQFRSFALCVDMRGLLLFHGLRAPIGVVFLWLMSRGSLTPEFALLAGWGDIVSGFGALALIAFARELTPVRRAVLMAWNTFGLVDIALVALTAQRIILLRGDMAAMQGLFNFPGPVLPLFVVPLVFATHLLMWVRLRSWHMPCTVPSSYARGD